MDYSAQIQRIKEKLKLLKEEDIYLLIFGTYTHKYNLNAPIHKDQIEAFETRFKIKLPIGYVAFLMEVGNGGAGPFYGLEPLENSIYHSLDFQDKDLIDPGKPFKYEDSWNRSIVNQSNEIDKNLESEYFSPEHLNGAIRICNYGCGVYLNLVVNGNEYGNIWTDDRCNDQGIYPSHELGNKERVNFLDWYELWLDKSLIEAKRKKAELENESLNRKSTPKIEKPSRSFMEALKDILIKIRDF